MDLCHVHLAVRIDDVYAAFFMKIILLYYLMALAVIHFVEAIYFKMWWLIPTAVLAGIGEIIGWSARYWSSFDDGTLSTPFLIQSVNPFSIV